MRRSLILLFGLACLSEPVWAWSLRCGSGIVSQGDPVFALRQRCGEPAQVEHFENKTPIERYDPLNDRFILQYQSDPYEIWTYNFGPRRLINRVTIRNGLVERIDTGGYGY